MEIFSDDSVSMFNKPILSKGAANHENLFSLLRKITSLQLDDILSLTMCPLCIMNSAYKVGCPRPVQSSFSTKGTFFHFPPSSCISHQTDNVRHIMLLPLIAQGLFSCDHSLQMVTILLKKLGKVKCQLQRK